MKRNPILLILTAFTLFLNINAQANEVGSKLSIMAIGQRPATNIVNVGEDKDGSPITREEEVDASFIPPKFILAKLSETEEPVSIGLTLNGMSKPFTFPNTETLAISNLELTLKPEVKNEVAVDQDLLLILHPPFETKSWEKPHHILLKNDWKEFPEDSVRITNVTSKELEVVDHEGERIIIGSGKAKVIKLEDLPEDSAVFTVQVYTEIDKKDTFIQQQALTNRANRRESLFFYHNNHNPEKKPILFTKVADVR